MLLGEKLEGGRRIDPSNGLIMPWYTSPCLEWLLTLDLSDKLIFEYGVGDSTRWYRKRGGECYGVDINEKWNKHAFEGFRDLIMPIDKQDYIESSTYAHDQYNIVIIDGDYRDECTEYALKNLKPGGYLIIDNYKQKSADLEHWPLTEKLIEGMPITIYKETGHEDWQTAVITKP